MKAPLKENFTLQKIKLISGGGLSVKFELEEVVGGVNYHSNDTKESSKEPHPDLVNSLEAMAVMVAQIFGYVAVKDIAYKKEFEATVSQKEYLKTYVEQMTEKIRVTGVALSGKGDKKGVVITSSFAVDNKQRVAMNTPRILMKSTVRGFEEELAELIDKIKLEAYLFVYENKVANPEMFSPNEFNEPAKMAVNQ